MICPKCTLTEMREENIDGVLIDRCQSCGGIWLDELELERLLEARPHEFLEDDSLFTPLAGDAGPRLNCPRCNGTYLIKLSSLLRRGTILDSCTICHGTWLDAGEFARLAGADMRGAVQSVFRG